MASIKTGPSIESQYQTFGWLYVIEPSIAVVLINFNGREDTLACLESLGRDVYPNCEIMVIDNNSDDGSPDIIRRRFPKVTVLTSKLNLGFSGGNNLGLKRALNENTEYIFFLNNDTVVQPGLLRKLVCTMEKDLTLGAISPLIHYYDRPDQIWFGGSTLDLAKGTALQNAEATEPPDGRNCSELPWLSGCAMFVRGNVLRHTAGFDERYFLYWEDVELSLRIRKHGYRLALLHSAKVYHKCGQSCNVLGTSAEYYYVRNNLRLVLDYCIVKKWIAVVYVLRGAFWRIRKYPNSMLRTRYVTKAVYDILLGKYGRAAFLAS